MMNKEFRLPSIYLKPSQLFMRSGHLNRPVKIITVLGSCVSVIFYNSRRRTAAMCHALLPKCMDWDNCTTTCQEPFKYVYCVVPEMISRFQRCGISLQEISVNVLGGSDMFNIRPGRSGMASVGSQNINAALDVLDHAGLCVKKTDLGGVFGRKIFFYPHTGEIEIKRLRQETREHQNVAWKRSL